MPRQTEAERLVIQRVGQDLFRDRLLDYWQGACAVSGLAVPSLLRASHIKPWSDCETDAERLDVFNGLLLSPSLDALFDGGWMTLLDDGGVLLAPELDATSRELLGVASPLRVRHLEPAHRRYLAWHRVQVFRRG
jgi:predicted restriction endonuclease